MAQLSYLEAGLGIGGLGQVIGDQIYIAGLMTTAANIQVGQTWMLDRGEVMMNLAITIDEFDELRQQIELRMCGKWDRAISNDHNIYVYLRTA